MSRTRTRIYKIIYSMEECLSNSWKILGQYLHLFQNLEKVQVIALYTKRVCDVGVS